MQKKQQVKLFSLKWFHELIVFTCRVEFLKNPLKFRANFVVKFGTFILKQMVMLCYLLT